MSDCAICGKKTGTVFLDKVQGTHVRIKGKKRVVCSPCQRANAGKDLAALVK